MLHLIEAGWRGATGAELACRGYPFDVPAVRTLDRLRFDHPVTFFVGENGSGKSTLLEAIAVAARLPTVGSADSDADDSLAGAHQLAAALRLSWTRRTHRGFFLRAEDFFGYLKLQARIDARIEREKWEAQAARAARDAGLDAPPPDRADASHGGAHADEIGAGPFMARYDSRSHGESFLELFESRLAAGGLYLLDEPETPLSPQRQLALLALFHDAVAVGAQFVIATHSPILLALPGARIYAFDEGPVRAVAYDEIEHVRLTRDFLLAPERYLRHLRGGGDDAEDVAR